MSLNKPFLEDITSHIFQGPISGADSIFILKFKCQKDKQNMYFSESLKSEVFIEKGILKPYIKGKQIKKYNIEREEKYILYPYEANGGLIPLKKLQKDFPYAFDYLTNKNHKSILVKRENEKFKSIWWSYSRPQNLQVITRAKIITPFNAFHNSFALDYNGDFIFSAGVAGGYGVVLKKEKNISYEYLIGVLNSSPIEKYLKLISTALRGGFYSYENRFIKQLPIYLPDPNEKTKYELCQKIEKYVKDILTFKKAGKNADANFLEKKIDEMVGEIYGV